MARKTKSTKNTIKTNNKGAKSKRQLRLSFPTKNKERIKKIFGLTCLTFSVFLLYAFTSFLFNWKFDQDLVKDLNSLVLSFKELKPGLAENGTGLIGAYFSHLFMARWFGVSSYLFIFLFFIVGFKLFFEYSLFPIRKTTITVLFIIFWLSTVLGFFVHNTADLIAGGFGIYAQLWFKSVFGSFGSIIILIFVLLIFLILRFNVVFRLPVLKKTTVEPDPNAHQETGSEKQDEIIEEIDLTKPKTVAEDEIEPEDNSDKKQFEEVEFEVEVKVDQEFDEKGDILNKEGELAPYDPTLDLSNYKFPTLDLLKDYDETETKINESELEDRKNLIIQTLRNYGIEIEKIKATVGSTVTLYEIIPAAGIRISKIKNLEDDIALSLAALGIRIIAPIPGKGTVGIEVPNTKPEIVSAKSVLGSFKFRNANMELPFALGKTIANEVFTADLTKMPHLLIAGATGQGKSVGLNVIISSLLYKKHPAQIKFVMVDPKKVELSIFQKIENHFLAKLPDSENAIITDVKQVIDTLTSLTIEMDARYMLFKAARVRNIVEYNKKFIARRLNPKEGHRFLPYIVLVVDELADLMMTAGKEVEMPIARLAQLARAIGIHLILATQRPSVNIITGTIKANFPARIAYKVSAVVDSRTILDSKGAEQLVGRGDMLFSAGSDVTRIQCAFIDTPEVENLVDYIANQQAYPSAHNLPEVLSDDAAAGDADLSELDSLFEDAARIVVQHQQGSTSLLQRRLKLGYNRAGRIIDQLESAGVVGPFEGSKARAVLIADEYALEQFLNDFRSNF
ncbi:MAG: DNA translocase FtsK [Bacteroidetes bacterium]|nr:DNA translocase FtsK [Bacteroidota bacterium]